MANGTTKFTKGVTLIPATASTVSEKGDLAYNSTTDKIEAYTGAASSNLVTSVYTGNVTLNGALAVTGNATLAAATATGLVVNGNETVTGTLGVSGAATINNNLTVTGTLGVSGAFTANGVATVNNALTVTGALGVTGALTTNGAATVNNNLTVTGNLSVSGTETIAGAVTINNTLSVTGNSSFASATATGLVVNGSETVTGNLTASGVMRTGSYFTASGISTPSAPAVSSYNVYPKSDGKLYIQDSAGTETRVGDSAVGTVSEIRMHNGNGRGSALTAIRRYTTTGISAGTDITYTDSATSGASFTVNADGWYSVGLTEEITVGTYIGVSYNLSASSQGTQGNQNNPASTQFTGIQYNTAEYSSISITRYATSGTILRPHVTTASITNASNNTSFYITRVG